MATRSIAVLVGALITLPIALPIDTAAPRLLAHHSLASPADEAKPITLTGKVTQVVWRSPHVFIRMNVPGKAAGAGNWVVETLNPQGLAKVGVDAATLTPGDIISVRAYAAPDVRRYAVSETMTLPSGRVVSVRVGTGM